MNIFNVKLHYQQLYVITDQALAYATWSWHLQGSTLNHIHYINIYPLISLQTVRFLQMFTYTIIFNHKNIQPIEDIDNWLYDYVSVSAIN